MEPFNANYAPQEFICPLTLELMINPVVNRHGNCYEKDALVEWLSQPNATCPLTRQPIRLSDFILDVKLQRKIKQWRITQGDNSQELTETSSTMDDLSNAGPILFVRAPSLLTEQPRVLLSKRNRFWKPKFRRIVNRA